MSVIPFEEEMTGAIKGFDALFSNDINGAKEIFRSEKSAVLLLGLGTTIFLQASLGMEAAVIDEAVKALNDGEAAARARLKLSKSAPSVTKFPPGTEWEILHADAIVLQGLTNALSETYYGYLQTLYALNSAHGKFMKLHKVVFPRGLDAYQAAQGPAASTPQSTASSTGTSTSGKSKSGFFGRLTGASTSTSAAMHEDAPPVGLLEEIIVNGAAFGFGLFNLVLSFLPAKAKSVVGLFGMKADRRSALQALVVASAGPTDPYAVFAGLEVRYPKGSLWILNRAKILHFTSRSDEAVKVLQDALAPASTPANGKDAGVSSISGTSGFVQADALLVFELALILYSQARYAEAADAFNRMTKLNTWSHATYLIFTVGCYISMGRLDDAQRLIDHIARILQQQPTRRRAGGDPPTEVYIKQKLTYWKEKQTRRGGDTTRIVDLIVINPADELATLWNIHSKSSNDVAAMKIQALAELSPAPTIHSKFMAASESDGKAEPSSVAANLTLTHPEEYASRSLLLGILHRTVGDYAVSRQFLEDVLRKRSELATSWIIPTSMFEMATLDLMEADASSKDLEPASSNDVKDTWKVALDRASAMLEQIGPLATAAGGLATRIEGRVTMLKDEIASKRVALGL